jgi:hypothetical protein
VVVEIKIEYGSVTAMAENQDNNIPWDSLIQHIKDQKFTPLISKRVSYDYLFGDRDIVEAWADEIKYPLKDKSNLARVAQFGVVTRGNAAKIDFLDFLKHSLFNIAETGQKANRSISLVDLKKPRITFSEVAKNLDYFNFEEEPDLPLHILAQLPLKVYLTTSPHTFLEMALKAAGKEPQPRVYCWCEKLGVAPPPKLNKYLRRDVESSLEQPLVFHLHGIDTFPESLVLSEDDFFEFLDNVTQDLKHPTNRLGGIPDAVLEALASSSLVLLGYNLYDWDFRVALRGVIAKLERTSANPSLLIQFRSGMENDGEDTERVQEYLEEHKQVQEYLEDYVDLYDFGIYWGNVERFTRTLREKGQSSGWFRGISTADLSLASKKKRAVKPTVFVSYSHQDEEEKEALLIHLRVLEHVGLINPWSDDRIRAGADWEAEICQAIDQANVAILLVTANFLTSDFILGKEIPRLLKRREREPGGLVVFPVIAKHCAWEKVKWLEQMQVRPKNKSPVWGDGGSHIDEDLAAIAEEVADICEG